MEQFSSLLDQVRDAGHKITQPRKAILELFASEREHLSAPEIYEKLEGSSPRVGLTTIYRTLDLLTRISVLKTAYFVDGCVRYEVNWPNNHHHHLICSSCGRVEEFGRCGLHELEEEVAAMTRYKIGDHMVQIVGVCPRCQAGRE